MDDALASLGRPCTRLPVDASLRELVARLAAASEWDVSLHVARYDLSEALSQQTPLSARFASAFLMDAQRRSPLVAELRRDLSSSVSLRTVDALAPVIRALIDDADNSRVDPSERLAHRALFDSAVDALAAALSTRDPAVVAERRATMWLRGVLVRSGDVLTVLSAASW